MVLIFKIYRSNKNGKFYIFSRLFIIKFPKFKNLFKKIKKNINFDKILKKMSIVPTIIEFLSISSVQYLFYKYSFPLFVGLPLTLAAVYFYFHSRISYGQTLMKGVIYDQKFPHSARLVSNLPVPVPNKNQVLIRVKCASLNPVDYKIITCVIPFYRWLVPPTVGRDFSGQIIQLGPGVTSFKVNDEVFGNAIGGSFQEFTVAHIDHIALKPEKMTWEQAAGVGLAGGTSFQSLKLGGTKKNSNVLIIGASGGTGKFGVLIAKHYGARVIGVCSKKNTDDVKQLGADKIINYDDPQYLKEIENEKFDVIYDTVSSPEDPDQTKVFMPFLKETGRYVAINGAPLSFIRGMFDIPIGRHYLRLLKWNRKDLEIVAEILKAQDIQKLIDSVFQFNQKEVEQVFERQKSRRSKGKIILQIEKSLN